MAQPALVQLKRKRNEEPLEYLLLQGVDKEPIGPRYKLQKKEEDAERNGDTDVQNPLQQSDLPASESKHNAEKRIFELQRKPLHSLNIRKRKDAADAEIATFVEKKQRNNYSSTPASAEEPAEADKPLKRPGKGSTLRTTPTKPPAAARVETESDRKQMEALAAYMSSTLSPPTRPAAVSTPKLSGARSAQIHRQRAATNGSTSTLKDLDADEESYVYDTYILAPSASVEDGVVELDDIGANVGYLVIHDDDRSLWEMYLEEDGASEKDWDSEEDDENAENYWAAEYPDEEEWSGSEDGGFGEGWRFRGWANDEEYHGDMGAGSEEEDVIRGGKVPSRFRRFE